MQRRGPVPSDFTTSPTTSDYRSDTCDAPIADDDFHPLLDENNQINSDCLASNFNSHHNNYVIFAENPRVNRIKSDLGIPDATLRGGIRKRSLDRRDLLRLAFHHMLSCTSSVKADSVVTFRDLLAARHKKSSSPKSSSKPSTTSFEPLIRSNLPPTTGTTTDLYDAIFLPKAKAPDTPHRCTGSPSSSTPPSSSRNSDINALI